MAAETIIEVENLSKAYRKGKLGTRSFAKEAQSFFTRNKPSAEKEDLIHWSVKDLNFSINKGTSFAIIGKNGAGKSTLLKLLSRITLPTKGIIRIDGRLSSLLEVGTGFHPDLTGRENIYLNGAILGMTKTEIRRKFDEIVDFSGVFDFIDTPVKKYSSGMYVRLAFAVAAHLEQDILIIDEVLAVGDAEFQRRCLGKMDEVTKKGGRTVIFVSHSMAAVRQLCTHGLLLEKGRQLAFGGIDEVLAMYGATNQDTSNGVRRTPPPSCGFRRWWLASAGAEKHSCVTGDKVCFKLLLATDQPVINAEVRLAIRLQEGLVVNLTSLDHEGKHLLLQPGSYEAVFWVHLPLQPSSYTVDVTLLSSGSVVDFWHSSTLLHIYDKLNGVRQPGLLTPESVFKLQPQPLFISTTSLNASADGDAVVKNVTSLKKSTA